MSRFIASLFAAFSLTVFAFGGTTPRWDYRVEYVSIPSGAFFDTAVTPGERPIARIACSATTPTIDIFGTPTAKAGCFIYNLDQNSYYLRYGTQANSGAFGSFVYGDYYEIDVAVDVGGTPQVLVDGVASKAVDTNVTFVSENITIPGKRYLGAMKLYSFVLENGGTNTCELIPCVKDGAVALYDASSDRFLSPSGGAVTAGPAVPDSSASLPWDRRVGSVTIPYGCYFDTGYVFKDNPAVELKVATTQDPTQSVLDIFGSQTRQAGCFILNEDHGPFYLRYGTQANTGAKKPDMTNQAPCVIRMDQTAFSVNGQKHADTSGPTDAFASNTETMCFPGKTYSAGERTWWFRMWDGGALVCDLVPVVKDGAVGFYDLVRNSFLTMGGSGSATASGSAPVGAYLLGRLRTAASGSGWSEGWEDQVAYATSASLPTNALAEIAAGVTYEIVLSGECAAGGLVCPGAGTLSLTGAGTLTLTELSADSGLSLALASGVTVRTKVFARGGAVLPRGLYTAANADWISGDGQLIVAGGCDRGFPTIFIEPTADGWYEFGKTSTEGGEYGCSTGYPGSTSTYHWIAGDRPSWDDYLIPAGAKLRLKGYVILETIPAGQFSQVDTSQLEYVLLHGQTAFADGTALTVPKGAFVRYQPGRWDLADGKYWLRSNDNSLPYAGDLVVNGTLQIYGDNTHLVSETFTGRLSGTGSFHITNYSNQGRFTGAFDFVGGWSSLQNANLVWIDTEAFSGRLTSCTFNTCDGKYGTNAQYCACGLLFGREGSDTPANRELSIETLVGYGLDVTDKPSGRRWRQGGHLLVWGENTVHVGKLTQGLHVGACRKDQQCTTGFFGSFTGKGNGHLVIDSFAGGTIYGSTNVSLRIGTMAANTGVDYTYQSGNVNRLTLDITNSCAASTTVKATDLAMLPARLSGFAGNVTLTGTDTRSYTIPVDFSQGPDALYQTVGCNGSGTLVAAPASGTIDATFRTDVEPERGRYALARFASGGSLLLGWTVRLNGQDVSTVEIGDRIVRVVKDDTGLYLRVVRTGFSILVR